MESLIADFIQFCITIAKVLFLQGRLVKTRFRDFTKRSSFSKSFNNLKGMSLQFYNTWGEGKLD